MKKSTLYKSGIFGLTLLGAGALISADDAQTNEGKIEMAYAELVTQFNEEQMNICKEQAMQAARMDMQAMQNQPTEGEGEEGTVGGGTVNPPTTTTPPTKGTTGGSETTPPPPPKKDVPTKTEDKADRMSGSKESTAEDKADRMSGSKESTADKKASRMSGGKK